MDIRPAYKFLTNTVDQQLLKVKEELAEAEWELTKPYSTGSGTYNPKALEEIMDLITASVTLACIYKNKFPSININLDQIQKDVEAKNYRRGYMEDGEPGTSN